MLKMLPLILFIALLFNAVFPTIDRSLNHHSWDHYTEEEKELLAYVIDNY